VGGTGNQRAGVSATGRRGLSSSLGDRNELQRTQGAPRDAKESAQPHACGDSIRDCRACAAISADALADRPGVGRASTGPAGCEFHAGDAGAGGYEAAVIDRPPPGAGATAAAPLAGAHRPTSRSPASGPQLSTAQRWKN